MKLFLSLTLIVSSFISFAQVKVDFKDGKQMIITGKKIGTNLVYDLDDPTKITKKIEYYLSEQKGEYTITFYSTWQQNAAILGSLDDIKVYKFTLDQLDSSPEVNEHTDDNDKIINYSLFFRAKEERPFNFDVYTKYKSTPERSSTYSIFSVYNDQKEPLSILAEKFKVAETSEE